MNLHYEFWVRYYDFLALSGNIDKIRAIYDANKRIIDSKWDCSDQQIPFQEDNLCLKIQYPGLLVGLGNIHDSGVKPVVTKEEENALQNYAKDTALRSEIGLGASLDHVTGLPVIPGSQVKGMLRSAFISNPGYIAEILGWGAGDDAKKRVCKLEQDIFGGRHPCDKRSDMETDKKGRDCFLDALPVEAGRGGRLFGIENITPHRAKAKGYERLNSPDILHLLKVIPGVIFQFRFILKDSTVEEGYTVTVQEKLKLFSEIFQDLGIGAKTSVGFGNVKSLEKGASRYTYLKCQINEETEGREAEQRPAEVRRPPAAITRINQIQPGMQFSGTVRNITDFGAFVDIGVHQDGMVHISHMARRYIKHPSEVVKTGDVVQVWVLNVDVQKKRIGLTMIKPEK